MGLARSQTIEDGPPRQPPLTTLHFEGSPDEYMRIEMVVRIQMAVRSPWLLIDIDRRLVIRASSVTGVVTAALETLRIE